METVWEYADTQMAERAVLPGALGYLAIMTSGVEAVRSATVEALVPFRTPAGAHRIVNAWHDLIATA